MAVYTRRSTCVRTTMGHRHAIRTPSKLTVQAGTAVPAHERAIRRRLQRDQAAWRERHPHAERADAGSDTDRIVLDRKLSARLEPACSCDRNRARVRSLGERAVIWIAEPGNGRRLYRVVGNQVSLSLLASDHGDSAG